MVQGIWVGSPIVDIRALAVDGKEHPVDSKDIAFQIAGREAFKIAFMAAGPVVLEPVMEIRVTIPEEFTGDVISDLTTKRERRYHHYCAGPAGRNSTLRHRFTFYHPRARRVRAEIIALPKCAVAFGAGHH